MALTLSLTSAELPRGVRCRLRAGPKSVVFVFCVFILFCFPFMVLEDLGTWHTSWKQFPVPGTSVQPPSGRHTGVIHTEFIREDAGGLGHGVQGGKETPKC